MILQDLPTILRWTRAAHSRTQLNAGLSLFCLVLIAEGALAALSAPPVSSGSYTVSWTESSGDHVHAYLLEDDGGGTRRLDVTGRQSRFFSKSPGTYTYRLEICTWEGDLQIELCNPPSPEVSVLVTSQQTPGTPTGLRVDPTESAGTFTLSWNAVAGNSLTYSVEERPVGAGTWTVLPSVTATSVTYDRADGRWSYRVRACSAVCGGYTPTLEIRVLRVPGVPGSLGPDETVGTTYILNWGAASGAVDNYELRESTLDTGAERVLVLSPTSHRFDNMAEGGYTYAVKACNDSGCGPETALKRVTVAPPYNISGPVRSTGTFRLSWTLPPGGLAQIARLEERRSGGAWHVISSGDGSTAATLHRFCSNCETIWDYRLSFCEEDTEPGPPDEICGLPGAVHSVEIEHQEDDERLSSQVPECTDSDRDRWERAIDSSQQVVGQDPSDSFVGRAPMTKTIIATWDNWFPVNGNKQTLCGRVDQFEVYDGFGDEVDFNHFLIPNPAHAFVLRDALPAQDVRDCAGIDDCVEVEVTPHTAFYGNPWFPRRAVHRGGVSSLVGREICVYGPWVTEYAHGDRPEIHPSESFWWRSREFAIGGDKDVFRMLTIQDDSNRFGHWAASPIDSQFMIAFELELGEPPVTYEIFDEELWSQSVSTSTRDLHLRDADDGKEHRLVYDGNVVLLANELQELDDSIGVRFADVCRETPTTLRGYVSLQTAVGYNPGARGDGFYAIRVERDYQALVTDDEPQEPPQDEPGDQWTRPQGLTGSLRDNGDPDRPTLLIDLEVGVPGGAPEWLDRSQVMEVWLVAEGEHTELTIEGTGPDGGALVPEVPIPTANDAVLEVRLETGETLEIAMPRIAATAIVSSREVVEATFTDSGWLRMVAATGRVDLPQPAAVVEEVSSLDVEVVSGYSMTRGGTVAPEEGSPLVEQLNEALASGEGLMELFGEERPFETEWDFAAVDLVTGEPVEVFTDGAPGDGAVSVSIAPLEVSRETLRIGFPTTGDGALVELTATLASGDRYGTHGATDLRFTNYRIIGEPGEALAEALLEPLAAAAELDPAELDQLIRDEDLAPADIELDPLARRGQILWYAALRFADDGEIYTPELADLLTLAERLASE